MSSRDEMTLPATKRSASRKSLSNMPSSTIDQENMTADIGALSTKRNIKDGRIKKSRSKSLGPGELNALKDTAGNRRESLLTTANPPPRSILKPTIPPLRDIPARKTSPQKTALLATRPSQNTPLIDFGQEITQIVPSAETEGSADPFDVAGSAAVNETRVSLRTEEEQQAAAREREQMEMDREKKEIDTRREARRKSLANRRVSFAPEATLHTWDVVVEYQDSTTSSNSTNSTRRASSASAMSAGSPGLAVGGVLTSDVSEPPSTPPEQIEEDTITTSPAHQRELHKKNRRRSSGIPPMNFNNPDEAFSSSPCSEISGGDAEPMDEDDDSNSDNSDNDGTIMSLDGETTDMSVASVMSASSSGSSARLDEALRNATRQANNQGMDVDEQEEAEEGQDSEVLASFVPWKKPSQTMEAHQDQENISPFTQGTIEPGSKDVKSDKAPHFESELGDIDSDVQSPEQDEMSMDVTRAFGGIISNPAPITCPSTRKPIHENRRRSVKRRSSGEGSSMGDETMDLTMAIGRIQAFEDTAQLDDMTMDFTAAVGGVLQQEVIPESAKRQSAMPKEQLKPTRVENSKSAEDETMEMEMEMTTAIGRIMPRADTLTSEDVDVTIGMDMTTAIGGIILNSQLNNDRNQGRRIMEIETDLGSSPYRIDVPQNSPPKAVSSLQTTAITTSETGSPSLAAFKGKGLRRSAGTWNSATSKSKLNNQTPTKDPVTPSKQITPQPSRPKTPTKTPPPHNVVMSSASPKRLFPGANSFTPQPISKETPPNKLFHSDKKTGLSTPNFILTPQRRVSTGVGIDRVGLGSPRLAALLDRRGSIGEQARSFIPSQFDDSNREVRFEDPRALSEAVEKERLHEGDRENKRKILEREADQTEDDKDATVNLKEMISSLTPRKNPLKGRKSLAIGAARGVLGKRPPELDDEEDDEDIGGVKRLKDHEGSPVKNVKLKAPPSKDETTGRLTRAARKSLEVNPIISTPTSKSNSPPKDHASSPHRHSRVKALEVSSGLQKIISFAEKKPIDEPESMDESLGAERIQLQDFLNMTNIRFMELNTTKRRHTVAPRAATSASVKDSDDYAASQSLENCVAAGAATIPMLELFQHACNELKNYISEGRSTVREIETETFEENPPLFQEYISATPDIKTVMDNQLKNVKTHARLLSKAMWYDWRMTLLATLKDGLLNTAESMIQDEESLDSQQSLLDSALPSLMKQAETLESQDVDLRSAADELASCDPEELSSARQKLIQIDAEVESKRRLVSELREKLASKETEIEIGTMRKESYLEEIRKSEKMREECRGWNTNEISTLKGRVDALESKHGWTITGVSGTTTSMTYRKEIELVFDASSFLSKSSKSVVKPVNSRIDLWYIASNREASPLSLTPEKEFFLESIRDHIRGLSQTQTPLKVLLDTVSTGWNKATAVGNDIRLLRIGCPIDISKTSDNSILIKSTLLIKPLSTKVELAFHLTSHSETEGIDVEISPTAKVIYGERFNEPKMREFLLNRIGERVLETRGSKASWENAVTELAEKLLARGKK